MLDTIRVLNSDSKELRIYDCRSRISAYANKAKMGGTESLTIYKNCYISFLGIENIHVMREAMKNLFLFSLDRSIDQYCNTWLQHIHCVLEGAFLVANQVNSGLSVLIHCSDGWDRTAQISSISQILLDPYYRTIIGFEKLIEKEWVSLILIIIYKKEEKKSL